jgi:uncharacterized HhH-GPD family protein
MLDGMSTLWLAQEPAADEMLANDSLALIVGMLLDQQIPLEKAFVGPYRLAERLRVRTLDARAIAEYDPEAFATVFATPPAIHRFPGAMAGRTQKLCQIVADEFDGDAATIWTGAASGTDLVKRIGTLPGFGPQKAQIFTALLGKQFGVQPTGWREAAGVYGEKNSRRSVADITDAASLAKVREYKKQMKAAAKAGD